MKKKWLSCILALFLGCNATVLAGCGNNKHTHDNKFYTAKQATCTEKGLIEILCSTCGEKSYQDTQPTGHSMTAGICVVCGYIEGANAPDSSTGNSTDSTQDSSTDSSTDSTQDSTTDSSTDSSPSEQPTDHTDFSAFYTLEDLYEKATFWAYSTKGEFYTDIENVSLTKMYTNGLGLLNVCANGLSLNLGAVRKDYVPTITPVDETLQSITVEYGHVDVVFANGTTLSIGDITRDSQLIEEKTTGLLGLGYSLDQIAVLMVEYAQYIVGITVNTDNQVFVRMGNNRILSLGKIAENKADTNSSALIFKETDGGYSVAGFTNTDDKILVIPPTHMGKPVVKIDDLAFANQSQFTHITLPDSLTEIGYGAFSSCSNLVSITMPNITLIQPYAFSSCHKLTSVVLPKTMQLICAYAFANCNNISTVYYLGTESEWNALDGIGVTSNESLLNAKRYYFSETSKAGCWHYVDGVPTVWQ